MKLGWGYCSSSFYCGNVKLASLAKHFLSCIKQQKKYQQSATLYITMAAFGSTICLTGTHFHGVKSYDKLSKIGKDTNNNLLVWQVFMSALSARFWMKDYLDVVQLSEQQPHSQHNRILELLRCFYEGIVFLNLARDTRRQKYRRIGEEAVKELEKLTHISDWNFSNKAHLVKAELHYLNGDLKSADDSYKSAIDSACKYKWLSEEALAYELYGVFCFENQQALKGCELLRTAMEKFDQWGATKKVEQLELFIDLVDPTYWKDLGEKWHHGSNHRYK